MKTVYQVQIMNDRGQDKGVWKPFCANKRYDVVETLEEAKKVLAEAKAWHHHCNEIGIEDIYTYRIATIKYTVEYTEA